MQIELKKIFTVAYLGVTVAVRYGDEDMPFDAPMRSGDVWNCVIDLDERRIVGWPEGKTLCFKDMKICDEGTYTLMSDTREILKIKNGYVPNKLLPGDYGDYLSLDIGPTGKILNWLPNANLSDFEE